MAVLETRVPEEVEAVRQQFVAFRSSHPVGSHLPEELWQAAVALARSYGLHRTSRLLHLDYTGLKKRLLTPNQKAPPKPAVTFVELTADSALPSRCRIEIEAAAGKFRIEGGSLQATDMAALLRTFLGQ